MPTQPVPLCGLHVIRSGFLLEMQPWPHLDNNFCLLTLRKYVQNCTSMMCVLFITPDSSSITNHHYLSQERFHFLRFLIQNITRMSLIVFMSLLYFIRTSVVCISLSGIFMFPQLIKLWVLGGYSSPTAPNNMVRPVSNSPLPSTNFYSPFLFLW